MTVELEIKDKITLREVLAFASQKNIHSRVFEDDNYENYPGGEQFAAKQLAEKLDNSMLQEGISIDEFRKKNGIVGINQEFSTEIKTNLT